MVYSERLVVTLEPAIITPLFSYNTYIKCAPSCEIKDYSLTLESLTQTTFFIVGKELSELSKCPFTVIFAFDI